MGYGVVNGRIARTLAVVGDRWSLAIIGELYAGRRRFGELRNLLGISRATLTRRLDVLLAEKMVCKTPYSARRHEYDLDSKGKALGPFLLLAWRWEQVWSHEVSGSSPAQLFHLTCNDALVPTAFCSYCEQPLVCGDLQLSEHVLQQAIIHRDFLPAVQTRRAEASASVIEPGVGLQRVVELIADRWTLLILIAVFFGVGRYEGFVQQLGISSNSLASRLERLVQVGILVRYDYQHNPPRSEYMAAVKGASLFPVIMALRQWAEDWGEGPMAPPLLHSRCGHAAVLEVRCGHCRGELRPRNISRARQVVSPLHSEHS